MTFLLRLCSSLIEFLNSMIVLATFCLNASRPDLALRSRYNTNDDKLDPGSEQEGKLRNEHPKGDR